MKVEPIQQYIQKNVLTGGVGSANSGGYFGPELKFSGFDYIIFEGRCDKPCYLWVNNGRAKIESSEHLWGKQLNKMLERINKNEVMNTYRKHGTYYGLPRNMRSYETFPRGSGSR